MPRIAVSGTWRAVATVVLALASAGCSLGASGQADTDAARRGDEAAIAANRAPLDESLDHVVQGLAGFGDIMSASGSTRSGVDGLRIVLRLPGTSNNGDRGVTTSVKCFALHVQMYSVDHAEVECAGTPLTVTGTAPPKLPADVDARLRAALTALPAGVASEQAADAARATLPELTIAATSGNGVIGVAGSVGTGNSLQCVLGRVRSTGVETWEPPPSGVKGGGWPCNPDTAVSGGGLPGS